LHFFQKPTWFQCTGIIFVTIGIIIKASATNKDELCYGKIINTTNVSHMQNELIYHQLDQESLMCNGNGNGNDCQEAMGIIFTIGAQFFAGCAYIYREKFIRKYDIHPLKAAGLEGAFGVLTLSILLVPMYFIHVPKKGIFGDISMGPQHKMEDAVDAIKMIFDGGQPWLTAWILVFTLSVGVVFYAGTTVTKVMSGTARAVIAQVSIVIVWLTFLLPLPDSLCRLQDYFSWGALFGLMILIIGVLIYNDIFFMPLARRYLFPSEPSTSEHGESEPLLRPVHKES